MSVGTKYMPGAHAAQKGTEVPWNWSYRWLWATMLMPEIEQNPLEELQVFLTTEPPLQT